MGEEVLSEEPIYKYTVKVESKSCSLLVFERNASNQDYATVFLNKNLERSSEKVRLYRVFLIESIIKSHLGKYILSQHSSANPNDAIDEMQFKILGRIA